MNIIDPPIDGEEAQRGFRCHHIMERSLGFSGKNEMRRSIGPVLMLLVVDWSMWLCVASNQWGRGDVGVTITALLRGRSYGPFGDGIN